MVASAATSMMGPIIAKLTTILSWNYRLPGNIEDGIHLLKDRLSTMDDVLQMLADMDQVHPRARDWRNKVRELSYDIEDSIDRFMLNHSHGPHGGSKVNFISKALQKAEILLQDRGSVASQSVHLDPRVPALFEARDLVGIDGPQLDPRVTALFAEARDLVGIDGPREEIIQLLNVDEKQHKVVSIYGTGGQGKTTLAMQVYIKITEAFDCRAFVSLSPTLDIKKIFGDILFQLDKNKFNQTQSWDAEQLIRTTREHLVDKRYLILIDDIWCVSAWEHVHSALPHNHNGSRVITTTRIKTVAESCCNGIDAHMYEAKPLSDSDSHRLFFKRLFFSSEDCPPDLREASDDILRKCGGLPLAIISIAGLLANRSLTSEVWGETLKSMSAAIDKDHSAIDGMRRILLMCYSDLPPQLRSCLLYLSVFPEDHLIDCRQLILLWVAEALIPGRNRESMEQLGRRYLNELINRSLIEPTKVGADGATVKECRVHDLILELIVSKAVEENFVTIWNRTSENYCSKEIRRLSIQENISDQAEEMAKTIKNAAHIRSIYIFCNSSLLIKYVSESLRNQVLRVLNMEGHAEECYLGYVESFSQMKYLRIATERWIMCKLPEDIEKLQHLETLDVRGTGIINLPAGVMQLQKLVRLYVSWQVQLPNGIENLHALEELSMIGLGIQSVKLIQELGTLTNLRVLAVNWWYNNSLRDAEEHKKACVSSLSKLFMNLQELHVRGSHSDARLPFMASSFPSPPPLRKLVLRVCNFSSMGRQISSLVNLTRLRIAVHEVSMEGINILARLPMLLSLNILLDEEEGDSGILYPKHTIKRQGFHRLIKFTLHCRRETALEFEPGAMPKLQRLNLGLLPRCKLKYRQGGLVLGLQNLVGLKHVTVDITCDFSVADDEAEALEDDIRAAINAHPNYPTLQIQQFKSIVTERSKRYGNQQSITASPQQQSEKSSNGVQQSTSKTSGMESSEIMELNILERIVAGSEEPSHLDLPLLRSITDNFSKNKIIGVGGCGQVYKGILRNGFVAVKRLFTIHTIKDKMFHQEVKTLIAVRHPNIVRFLGYCSFTEEHVISSEGQTFMADIRERLLCFDYIRNGSLESHLTDELRGLEWYRRFEIIVGICMGLVYLHVEKGIIHMDLKPANILLDDNMVPKITDFGLSKLDNTSQTTTASRLITPIYCAPEYFLEGKSSSKSDIYSLGVIIQEVVMGSNKKLQNITKVLRRWRHRWIKSSNHTPLSYQQVTKCLELAEKCTERDPTGRPDILDIVAALNQTLDSKEDQFQVIPGLVDMLGIEPLEIHCPFEERDGKLSRSIELINDTDDYFAFITKPTLRRLRTHPEKGIVPPRSKCSVTVTMMQAQVNALPIDRDKVEITVLSTRVDGSLAAMDIAGDMFIDEDGKVVDEVNVMVVQGSGRVG